MKVTPEIVAPLLYNARVTLQNVLSALPGQRPKVVVFELSGGFPARAAKYLPAKN